MPIAKKTKKAIYALIAVAVIAALAAGCTLPQKTEEPSDTPWGWAQSALQENMTENASIDTKLLAQILNKLDKTDFSQSEAFDGSDDVLTLLYAGKLYPLALSERDGVVTLQFDGVLWDIASQDLFLFVQNCIFPVVGPDIALEIDGDIPQAVIDYATEYTRTQLLYYTDDLNCEITEAKIISIEQIDTGTAGLLDGLNLYSLEFRFLPAEPDEVTLPGDLQLEEGYITEWTLAGQPYLLLRWQFVDSETVWERICTIDSETMTRDYGTLEMLDKYGHMYTATAVELYKKYSAEE